MDKQKREERTVMAKQANPARKTDDSGAFQQIYVIFSMASVIFVCLM